MVAIWDITFTMLQVLSNAGLSARDKKNVNIISVKYYGCHNSNHNGQIDGHCCDIITASINFQHVVISLNISFP